MSTLPCAAGDEPATIATIGALARMQKFIDVFNGDADGLLARHQLRLSFPIAIDRLMLVSGVKRDIALLDRLLAAQVVQPGDQINVFDISYDRNADAVRALLENGVLINYFDHHRASHLKSHDGLVAHIDESADVCTSLLVDRQCQGAHRLWAIAAAFGDNLTGVARQLAQDANLAPAQAEQLRQLGECLNYNAYGETVEDLHYHPVEVATRLQPYPDPFQFIEREDILARLLAGYEADLARAQALPALHAKPFVAVYLMPDEAWARRVSGAFANQLVHAHPGRAHAVLTADREGSATVSIRAPRSSPRDAALVATRFANGGGRAAAAGIESFSLDELPRLIAALEETYR